MAVVASAAAGLRAAPRATVLQLRDPAAGGGALEQEARALLASCSLPVLVSSRCDVALAAGAAGVNLPERDIGVSDARRLLGTRLLVGRSVHSLEAARSAEREGADFVIFGPVWPSATHPGGAGAGVAALAAVARALAVPVIAVGGVTGERVADVHAAGAAGFAAIGAFA